MSSPQRDIGGSDQPADLARRFAAAWNVGDAAAIADLFIDDPDFVNVVGLWWKSRAAIRTAHAYGFEHIFPNARMTLENVAVRTIGADAATVHALWRLEGQSRPAGDTTDLPSPNRPTRLDRRRGILLLVAERQADGWHAVAAQNTDIIPGAETITADGARRTPRSYRTTKR